MFFIPQIVLVLITACSSSVRRDAPPDLLDKNQLRLGNSQSHKWWRTYKLAVGQRNSDPEKSCRNFSNLSDQIEFPLQMLAQLKAISSCAEIGTKLEFPGTVPEWLSSAENQTRIDWSLKFQPDEHLAELLLKKSKLSLPMEEKIELVRKAITLTTSKSKKREYDQRILKLAPRFIKKPRASQWMKVARDYSRQRQFKQARRYFNKINRNSSLPWSVKRRAKGLIASTYKLQSNNKQYLKELIKLQKFVYKKSRRDNNYIRDYHDVSIRVARRHWTLGNPAQAKRELKKLERKIRGKHSTGKIHWLLGRIAEEKKKYDVAIGYFDKAIANTSDKNARLVYRWYRAWNLRKAGNYYEALNDLAEIIAKSKSARAQYWHARTLKDLDMLPAAQIEFEQLAKSDSFGYYGILAHRESGDFFDTIDPHMNLIPKTVRAGDLNILDWLVAVGELSLAQKYIGHLSRDNQDLTRIDKLGLYARAGIYLPLFIELGKIEPDEKSELLKKYPQLLFPRPYSDEVFAAASKFSLDPAIIYSIIRQESAFNPMARSHADAFGLMQLLEPIAKKYGRINDRHIASFNDLYVADTNIFLGAALLKDLFNQQKGFIPAVASYNANKNAIKRWIETRFDGDATEFIEDVPYKETQQYIQLVMRNYVFYQRMTAPAKPLIFPEWCLKNIHDVKS